MAQQQTETTRTPGPWVAKENGGDDPDERRLIICAEDRYGNLSMIARVDGDPDPCDGDPEANARLIAAAPDLMRAVEDLLPILEAVRYTAGLGKSQLARIENARAALAKASN